MAVTTDEAKPWPGSTDGSCPSCGVLRNDWDMEYRVARLGRFGVEWTAPPGKEQLIALTCPVCQTRFKVAD